MKLLHMLAATILTLFLESCGVGLIYTHTIRPIGDHRDLLPVGAVNLVDGSLSRATTTSHHREGPNLHGTRVAQSSGEGDTKSLQYSVYRIDWDDNGIGAIAKNHGFDEIYYADLETLSVLGIWTQNWVHVYGKKARGPR